MQESQETQYKRKHNHYDILWILWGKVVVSKLGGHCYELTTVKCIELTSGKGILKLNLVFGLSISLNQAGSRLDQKRRPHCASGRV